MHVIIRNQMLGCGAHVRIIALPHVRCACGSACEMHSVKVRVRCAISLCTLLQQNVQNLLFFNFLFKHSKTYKDVLNRIGCYKTEFIVPKQDRTFYNRKECSKTE